MNDQAIEQEIQAKGKTAPRITPAHIQSVIVDAFYFTAKDGAYSDGAYCEPLGDDAYAAGQVAYPPCLSLLTFCVLVLENGFTVTGESACASPENFDPEIGRKIARQNAEQKIWPLEGYLLKARLHSAAIAAEEGIDADQP